MSTKKRIPNVQRKKSWEVIRSSKDNFTGLGIDGKFGKKHFRKFGKSGAFVTHDEGEANYIKEVFGSRSKTGDGSVVVAEVDNAGSRPARRVFVVNLPWRQDEEEEEQEDGTSTTGN